MVRRFDFLKLIVLAIFLIAPLVSFGNLNLKHPKNPDSKGQYAQCMRKNAPGVCRDWALKKMGDYANAIEYVRIHNKAIASTGNTQRRPLNVDKLSEKFEKWYMRFLALDDKNTHME